jgi:Flp pilus assembly protein TadD
MGPPSPGPDREDRRAGGLGAPILLALALITFLAFLPALRHGLVDWDDNYLLAENTAYRGFGPREIRWMFTSVLLGHYVPVTWLSFAVDHAVWGTDFTGYHLTNVLLHVAAALLFALVAAELLRAATGLSLRARRVGAGAAALFFAIHPLRVETVAWLTDRRGVLSGVLALLTVLLYLGAARAPGARRRWLVAGSVGAYLLALGAKSSVMTLPGVLVLLDVYPLRRLPADPRGWLRPAARRVWLEKLPYAILALAVFVVAFRGQAPEWGPWTGSSRLANIAVSLWFYAAKTAVPVALSPLYEAPRVLSLGDPRVLASALGVAAITAVLLGLARRFPAGLAAWVAYGLLLAPVSGIVPMGAQLTADRYSYLACLGGALLVGGGAGWVVDAAARGRLTPSTARLAGLVGLAAFAGLAALTWQQTRIWRNGETLFAHAVALDPACSVCRANLGVALVRRGALVEGLEHLLTATRLRDDRVMTYGRLGWAYARLGMDAEASEAFRQELRRRPRAADVRIALGRALIRLGRFDEATGELRRAIRLAPREAEAHAALGAALSARGEHEAAIEHFQRALALRPDAGEPRAGLDAAYRALGRDGPAGSSAVGPAGRQRGDPGG